MNNRQTVMVTAVMQIVQCKVFLFLSSLRTSTMGLDVVSLLTGSFASLLVSISTWYLQHGSNCHETVYSPVQSKDKRPNGVHT